MRILYVEDEKYLADAVVHLLKQAHISVDWVDNGNDGLTAALKPVYDAIVLDIMLPGLSGLEILKTIRSRNVQTPVIMLSALSQVEDKIKGLEDGADDYLAKPFKTSELIARLNALTRRPPLQEEQILTFADLSLDLQNRTLNDLPLTDKEAEVLKLLLRNPGHTQNKAHILAHVWGQDAIQDDNYVEVYISYLRRKLKKLGSTVKIQTVRGLGYKLVNKES